MKTRLGTSAKIELRTKYIWLTAGSIVLAAAIIFLVIFGVNFFGINHSTRAQEGASRYPFELTDKALQKVNFTVLAPQINSVFAEVRPFITSNGKELFFCRRNHPDNVLKQKDKQDIWMVSLQGDQWGKPVNIGDKINSKNADAICSISPDGSEIVFINDKMDQNKPLSKSVRQGNEWSEPEAMEIKNFYNLTPYIDFYFSYETNVLLMAIEREDSKGEQDLYVSFRKEKNSWSEPQSLGPVINSAKSDFAPFLSSDGKTLYFSSYGHDGFGGCDIFQTTRLDNSWKNWSKPKNLGEGINSPREESYFSVSGDYKYIYFESYDLNKEVRDIFRADLPAADKPLTIPVLENPVVVATKKEK